ncbi:MAG TPA: peptidylprolyl isomerase [Dehalococcoidia bacterium]|nr:peptidylprolyl isomerase [Dehalococcoidia bacterium]
MSIKTYGQPPEFNLDPEKTYKAVIEMAQGNKITIDLLSKEAPKTVNNFVFLARDGYYDGITFHRVIPGFMAQSGDPTGTGSGGPGYNFDDEFHDDAKHDSAGILSMANRGVVNGMGTNGSQFFITSAPTPHLDGHHSVFGRVSDGIDAVNSIKERDPGTATIPGETMKSVTIVEN